MTTTKNRPITIADAPAQCPPWCPADRHNALYASGCVELEDFQRHELSVAYRHLPALATWTGRPLRQDGDDYEVAIEQDHGSDPLINLRASGDMGTQSIELSLSAGDARSMAAQLLRAADLLDFDGSER